MSDPLVAVSQQVPHTRQPSLPAGAKQGFPQLGNVADTWKSQALGDETGVGSGNWGETGPNKSLDLTGHTNTVSGGLRLIPREPAGELWS